MQRDIVYLNQSFVCYDYNTCGNTKKGRLNQDIYIQRSNFSPDDQMLHRRKSTRSAFQSLKENQKHVKWYFGHVRGHINGMQAYYL